MSSEEAAVETPQSVDKAPEEERKDEIEKGEVKAPEGETSSNEIPPAPPTEFDENNKKVSEEPPAIANPPPVKDPSEEISVHDPTNSSTHASAHESQS